ncbi:hypothetical protein BDY24DRAFT_388146 [Mrakia frigida]|uniref:HMG-box domain-containing protein n=1 Tax=Mrakia frigida TaxID=29902 RepID=UPI003FCBFBA2
MSEMNVKLEAKAEPFDFSFPPPSPSPSRPSISSTSASQPHVKPEPSSSSVPPVKSEPGSSSVGFKRSREGTSPVPSAPAGWIESPEATRKRQEARERERVNKENKQYENPAQKRRRLAQPKPEKKPPSAYNIYMKEKLAIVTLETPGMPPAERFKIVADSWKFSLKNPKNVVRPWTYGPPLPGAIEEGQAGPSGSGTIVIDGDEDDGEVQVVEDLDSRLPASVDASLETEDSTIDLTEEGDGKAEFKEELDVKPKDEALEAKGEDVSLTEEAKPEEEEHLSVPLFSCSTRPSEGQLAGAVGSSSEAE